MIIKKINDCWAWPLVRVEVSMPPKKKQRLLQKNLFGELVSSTTAQEDGHESEETSKRRRGDVDSWRSFAMPRFKVKYPW